MTPTLTDEDRRVLGGERGEGAALAMRLVVKMAEVARAPRLRDVTRAHIDSCLDHGQAGLDFAERLLAGGAAVSVPATLNVSSLDLLHPELVRLAPVVRDRARRLMDAYVEMGCRPTWTCAPYQLPDRPGFGEHIAWAESNAIVFANSVLGARTNRYGDFIDICAAVTGRVPDSGLHTDRGRRATLIARLEIPDELLDADVLYPVLGHLLGRIAGNEVAAIEGLQLGTSEARLKALGAAAASSGAVGLFHAIGVTPEAPTRDAVVAEQARDVVITRGDLRAARDELSSVREGAEIAAVSVGTPHASAAELRRLTDLVDGEDLQVPFYVNTGRTQLELGGGTLASSLAAAGVTVVTDTCTYVTPVMRGVRRPVMTDSAKWAWYAPSNLGYDVALGSLEECVRSAVAGRVIRDEGIWD